MNRAEDLSLYIGEIKWKMLGIEKNVDNLKKDVGNGIDLVSKLEDKVGDKINNHIKNDKSYHKLVNKKFYFTRVTIIWLTATIATNTEMRELLLLIAKKLT